MRFYKIVFFVIFFVVQSSFAQVVSFNPSNGIVAVSKGIEILEDKENKLTFEEVRKSKEFKLSKEEVPNFQISKSAFWAKFTINNTSKDSSLVLELPYPIIDKVALYSLDEKGDLHMDTLGEDFPVKNRIYKHQNYLFPISVPSNQSRQYYIKINGSEQMQLPLYIGTSQDIYESLMTRDFIFGLYGGLVLVMLLYNLFIFFVVRDTTYLFYVSYILTVGLTQACIQGYTFRFLWPNSASIANISMVIVPALSGVTALEFLKNFLQVKKFTPQLYKLVLGINGLYLVSFIFLLLGDYQMSQNIIQVSAMLGSILVLIIGYKIAKKGYRPAFFFLTAWSIFLASIVVFVLRNFNLLPFNSLTYYALQIGSGVEMILLSFALADRINILKKEKEISQGEALKALEENQRIIKEQNVILETKVVERTTELTKSNDELSSTLDELKQTQSQLVNAEKMASLGQLTAGIAHEINNPINFVVSNVKPLRRDIEDIQLLVDKYERALSDGNLTKEALDFKKEIDYLYVKDEIDNLLKGIEEGASRTADIVKGLRVFSRLDENDLKKINIIDGLESTLTLLNPEIANVINLVREYDEMPAVECYPGKINQVFMNILNNAIFAIKAHKTRKEKGELLVKAFKDGTNVKIVIRDNGIGMSEEVKAKVFDPFFTTKDVGKGTGLGMSISFSIIEDHNGSIEVITQEGKGTEFTLTLPILQKSI